MRAGAPRQRPALHRVAHFALLPEGGDDESKRSAYADANAELNEFLYRRVDIEGVVEHLLALECTQEKKG